MDEPRMDEPRVDIILAILIAVSILPRIFIFIICWILKLTLNLDVKIQGMSFFSLDEINVVSPVYTMKIKRISVCCSNVRDGLVISVNGCSVVKNEGDHVFESQNHSLADDNANFIISSELATLLKWFSVEVHDLDVWSELGCQRLLHITAAKVDLNFSELDVNQCLVAKANFNATTVAVHAMNETDEAATLRDAAAAEHKWKLSWNTAVEAVASIANDKLSLEKLCIDVECLNMEIREELSSLIFGKCDQEIITKLESKAKHSFEDALYYFSPVIPKAFHLGIHGIEVSGMKGSSSPYTVSIHSSSLTLSNIMEPSETHDIASLGRNMCIDLCINGLEVEINLLEAIKIEKFTFGGKAVNRVLVPTMEVLPVVIVYHHEELLRWLRLNFKKSSLNKGKKNMLTLANNSSLHCENGRFLSVGEVFEVPEVVVQMAQLTVKYYQSPIQIAETASVALDLIKLSWEKNKEIKTGELELNKIQVKKLWCYLGRMPFNVSTHKDKYHTWGSPLYIDALKIQMPSKGQYPGPMDVLLLTLQMEWSPGLSQVALGALRRMLDFQAAISDLCTYKLGNVKPSGSELSAYYCPSTVNVTILDCNVYLLDDLTRKGLKKTDLCYMLRFDTMFYRSSPKKISFDVDGFKAITILQERSGQHACVSCRMLKGYWFYVHSFEGVSHKPFGEMKVQLQKDVEIYWNHDLHTRFFAMTSDVQNFYHSLCKVGRRGMQKDNEVSMNLAVSVNCEAKVVVDLFQSLTLLHIYFSNMQYISTHKDRCIRAHICRLNVLKGGLFGINTASIAAVYNQCSRGFIYHEPSNTSLFLSIHPNLEKSLTLYFISHILFLMFLV